MRARFPTIALGCSSAFLACAQPPSAPVRAPASAGTEAPVALPPEDAGPPAGFTDLAPPGARFSVRIPGAPHEDVVESAPLTMHVFESETAGDVVYAVAYTDYPDDFPAASDPERLLDAARDALVDAPAGTLVYEARITLAPSTAGRELTIRRDDHLVSARLYAECPRVYELTVRARENVALDAEKAAFFDSFLIKR